MAKKKRDFSELLTNKPRAVKTIEFQCFASPKFFLAWEDTPQIVKDEIKANGPVPCEGGGVVGAWCESCRFGVWMEKDGDGWADD